MRWVVRIDLKGDQVAVSAVSGAVCIERARLEDAARLGLTLEDGTRIMAFPQKRVVTDQRHNHGRSSRRRSACAGLRGIKDHRHRVIDAVFGRANVASPRPSRQKCARPAGM